MRLVPSDRSKKQVSNPLQVYGWTTAGFIHAGTMDLQEEYGVINASFSYSQAWLDSDHTYPLDPINLPRGTAKWATQSQFIRLGAIFDAAPDAWGRKVVQYHQEQEGDTTGAATLRNAFLRGADGIGALVLTPSDFTTQELADVVERSLAERPSLSQLDDAIRAAHSLEQLGEVPEELEGLLAGSWTIGGARPKAILRDDRPAALHGESIIAKFPSINDTVDRGAIECASLQLAHDMGFETPREFWIKPSTNGHHALMMKRFDRPGVVGDVQRAHYLSAISLISHEIQNKLTPTALDRAMLSWGKLIDTATRLAKHPSAARVTMYARLCLNAALQNTDDHLKNFGFLKDADSPLHYTVAPVFDVSPQPGKRHYMYMPGRDQHYTLADALAQHKSFGVSKAAAEDIKDRILGGLAQLNWGDYLSQKDSELVQAWVRNGIGDLPLK